MNDIEIHSAANNPVAAVIVTVREEDVFERDLLASIKNDLDRLELVVVRNAKSQASALNLGIAATKAEVIICPHQDVAFGAGWLDELLKLLSQCPRPWGVCGMAGTAEVTEFDGKRGKMYGTHSGLGMDGYKHVTAQTLDGSVLVLRRSAGLRFDEESFPHFHGYDVDICLQAAFHNNLACYVLDVPMEHRTKWTAGPGLPEAMTRAKQKWGWKFPTIWTTFGTY